MLKRAILAPLAGALLAGCNNLQIEPVKIDISDLLVNRCDPGLSARFAPSERKLNCYEIQGKASNRSYLDLRRVNLYGVIQDASGTTIREGRLGGIPDLVRRKTIPFKVRVLFTQKVREPLRLEAFRAKGLT